MIFPWLVPVFNLYEWWQGQSKNWVLVLCSKMSCARLEWLALGKKLELRIVRIAASHLIRYLAVPLIPRRRGAMGNGVPDVLQSTTSSTSPSSIVQFGILLQFSDWWRSITSNSLVLNRIKGHHLLCRCHPPLFCIFKWFNIKAVIAHYLLSRRRWMSYQPRASLNHEVLVLAFIQMYLQFLGLLVFCDPYPVLSDSIAICIYLLFSA